MIITFYEQDTPEWMQSRSGVATASEFAKIMTPTGNKSSQSDSYMNLLVAEWILNQPINNETYGLMEYGKETEEQARNIYEFITGHEVTTTGIIYKDNNKLIGCSPDVMMCDTEKGAEIKCPAPHTHISYMLAKSCPIKYIPQVQGSMYITGYQEWDFMSYHPDFPPMIVTVKRDDEYIEKLDKHMVKFLNSMLAKRDKLKQYRMAA